MCIIDRTDDRYRLILPLSTHPLVETADEADRARWLIGQDDYGPPAEVAFALAGPAAEETDAVNHSVAQLSLGDRRPARPQRPHYII